MFLSLFVETDQFQVAEFVQVVEVDRGSKADLLLLVFLLRVFQLGGLCYQLFGIGHVEVPLFGEDVGVGGDGLGDHGKQIVVLLQLQPVHVEGKPAFGVTVEETDCLVV